MSDVKVLVLLGSLRSASINRQLAELAIESAPDGVSLQLFQWRIRETGVARFVGGDAKREAEGRPPM